MAGVQGPDSSLGWLMVAGCFIANAVTYGLARSHGVYYMAILDLFPVSRSDATWPFCICMATTSLVGPLAGALCQKFGTRAVIFGGTIIASFGFLTCFAADDIHQLTVFFGLIHGFGLGLAMMPVPVTINQYFVKHRATAQGVAFSGSTISSFAYPALLDYCVKEYGLRGTFILSAGIVLHALVGASIIQSPPWLKAKPAKPLKQVVPEIKPPQNYSSVAPINDPTRNAWDDVESREIPLTFGPDVVDQLDRRSSVLSGEKNFMHDPNVHLDSQSIRPSPTPDRAASQDPLYDEEPPRKKTIPQRIKLVILGFLMKIGGAFGGVASVMGNPMFPLIATSWVIFLFVFLTFILIIGDFAKDNGIMESKSVFIFSAFSAGDLFGRLGLGWVTDKKFLTRKTYTALSMATMGSIIIFIPIGFSYNKLLVEAVFLGVLVGSTLMIFFVLYAEYFKPEQVALAIGLNTALNGLAAFFRPSVIGFFRDTMGSYAYLFYVSGAVMQASSLLWLAEPWIMRRQKARERRVQDIATIS